MVPSVQPINKVCVFFFHLRNNVKLLYNWGLFLQIPMKSFIIIKQILLNKTYFRKCQFLMTLTNMFIRKTTHQKYSAQGLVWKYISMTLDFITSSLVNMLTSVCFCYFQQLNIECKLYFVYRIGLNKERQFYSRLYSYF